MLQQLGTRESPSRSWLQEAQQRCTDLQAENARLRTAGGGNGGVTARSAASTARQKTDPTLEPVQLMYNDFTYKKGLLDDDLSFIQEVVTGASTAIPDFNPEVVRRGTCDGRHVLLH